jgi:hypothetical protein
MSLVLVIGLSVAGSPSSFATIKAGSTCSAAGKVVGQNDTSLMPLQGFQFLVCTKDKLNLIWKTVKYSKKLYSAQGPYPPKLFAQRQAPYPGEGKKCVVGDCPLGSVGPAGGTIFYDAGSVKSWGRYLEVAPILKTGDPQLYWCGPDSGLQIGVVTGTPGKLSGRKEFTTLTMGQGRSNTAKMAAKCPQGAGAAAFNYLGGKTADWFLPSASELNELCKFAYGDLNTAPEIACDSVGSPRLGFLSWFYWSSTQVSSGPLAGAFWFGKQNYSQYGDQITLPTINTAHYRPIRAFSSPSDSLVSPASKLAAQGIVQLAGIGDPSWPVQCPVVIDQLASGQPKVTAVHFNNNDETFSRLQDGTSNATQTPGNLVGCYVDLPVLTSKDGNFYHIGTINRDKNGYFWQNGGGDPIGGRIRLSLSGTTLTTTSGDPDSITLIP